MQTNNAQSLNMQNAKNWESRDTAYLVRWRPRLFQSSTVCKSPLVLNAKDDLRADGQSFCFLASGIQRETPFSFLLSLFRSPLFLLVFCTFFSSFCRPKVSPCFFLVSPLFFSSFLFSSFSSTACLPDLTATQGWRKKLPLFYAFFSLLTAYLSCVFCLSFSVFLCSLLSFSAWLPFFFFRLFFLS